MDGNARMDGGLNLRTVREDGVLVITALGEVDIATAKLLDAELRRAFSDGAGTVLLDLGRVEFIDSTGLKTLLIAARSNRQLRIAHLSMPVRRTIEVSGVADALPIVT